jgi:hypothetical protein
MTEDKILLVFESTRAVVLAERECKSKGFKCVAVPAPREYTAQCGIALEVPANEKDNILKFFKEQKRPFKYFEMDSLNRDSNTSI